MGPVDLWYYTGVTLESIWVRDTWFTSSHWIWINNWQCWLQTPIFIKLDLPIFYWVFFWFSGLQRVQTLIVTTAQLQTKKPSDGFIRTMPNNFFGRSWMRRLRKYFLLWNTVHETSTYPPHPHPHPHPLKISNWVRYYTILLNILIQE
jgi:hypothetical protein